MLSVENLTKQFGGLTAVDRVSIAIDNREIVGLMGPNGSGKSTFTNCVSGVYSPTSGTVRFNEIDITGRPTFKNARDGLARTFQTPRVFEELTVLENVTVPLLNTSQSDDAIDEKARSMIETMGLSHVIDKRAKQLSGGQKKLVEFARNMMRDPTLVLMDEPFAGVHPEIKQTMFERIEALNEQGAEFLVVSHEVDSLYAIADQIVVFDHGKRIASGVPAEIQENDRVVEAYLGDEVVA